MRISRMKLIVLLFILVCASRGGTYLTRVEKNENYRYSGYYMATIADLRLLGLYRPGYDTLFCYADMLCAIRSFASLPFDFIIDTLSIPYDYMRADLHKRMTYHQVASKAAHGFIEFDFSESRKIDKSRTAVDYWVMYVGERTIFLDVMGAPLKTMLSKIIVPQFDGYKPYSVTVYYGEKYAAHGASVFLREIPVTGLRSENGSHKDVSLAGRKAVVCHEYRPFGDDEPPNVLITSYFNDDLQVLDRSDTWKRQWPSC